MSAELSATDVARDYYDSEDADAFYQTIWGGEDIHIGIYERPDEAIADASRRTVERMISKLEGLGPHSRVLDMGSGYCGAARHLARSYQCQIMALNLSEVENERARVLNQERGLADNIRVIQGSFDHVPAPAESFDIVWSNDALLHGADRTRALLEVSRVLRPGGTFVFTDPMQADDCPAGVLDPILARIHLTDLGSPGWYRREAEAIGLIDLGFEPLTEHLVTHYSRVLEETRQRAEALGRRVSPDYLERMQAGLQRWIDGGKAGHLCWGIFRFRKR